MFWKSSTVAEQYIDESIAQKMSTSGKILTDINSNERPGTSTALDHDESRVNLACTVLDSDENRVNFPRLRIHQIINSTINIHVNKLPNQ